MKKFMLITSCVFIHCGTTWAQTKKEKDTTLILPYDIYSNFSKENYAPANARSFIISRGNTDSIQLLSPAYDKWISAADKFYTQQDYANAVNCYNKAIGANNGLGKIADRIKMAGCYGMLGNADAAFQQLYLLAGKGSFTNAEEINTAATLAPLHDDSRWNKMIQRIRNRYDAN
jgi:uncharacterized protein YciU (UPF0263 family)